MRKLLSKHRCWQAVRKLPAPLFPPRAVLADHRNPIPSATPNFYTLMKTLTLTQRREILAKAWKNYVTTRRAYCHGRATVQQLAHALALVGVAEVRTSPHYSGKQAGLAGASQIRHKS
jgi:hypothetical protein